ncbi:polyubiquitin 11 isoform X2, partial [Tanacetum coccineum]
MRVSKGLMQIYVINAVNIKSTSIEVKPSDTIGNLKNKINCMERIPIDKQVLIFNEMVLHDSGTLADFDIKRESTLTLMRKTRGSMQILVQSQCGRKISLEVNPLYTIANLKARLMEEGFSPGYQLFFKGTRLMDSCTYADYNILKDNVIEHMYELKGGGI